MKSSLDFVCKIVQNCSAGIYSFDVKVKMENDYIDPGREVREQLPVSEGLVWQKSPEILDLK